MLSMCGKEERNTMRNIQREWFKQYDFLDVRFVVDEIENGNDCRKLLASENAKHDDIVYVPTEKQGYNKLIYKVEAMIHWAGDYFTQNPNYLYLFKTDDDALVQANILKDIVVHECGLKSDTPCYFGAKFERNEAHATSDYVTHTGLERIVFPFMSGAGYGFSRQALLRLAGMSKGSGGLIKYNAEDATVGQWMNQIQGVHFAKLRWNRKPMCENPQTEIVHAIKDPVDMQKMMDLMKQGKDWGPYCKTISLFGPKLQK
jgi:hypothetical protein